jgi:uncharacterized protein YciW
MPQSETRDTIDAILGVEPGSGLAELRERKPELAEQLEAYYRSIFEPTAESAAQFSVRDRALVAVRVASHTGSAAVTSWYERLALKHGATHDELARVGDLANAWSAPTVLAAAIRHADLLTTTPSAATSADLQALKEAGFTPAGIVTLSQTIAFVSYQLRLIAALRAIGEPQ